MKIPKIKIKTSGGNGIDMPLLTIILVMIAFGIIMIFSASSPTGFYENGDEFYYIKKQLIWTALGSIAMLFCASIPLKYVKRYGYVLGIVAFALMMLVVFIGKTGGGAQRWLGIGSISFQPSEFAKFALVFCFAKRLSETSTSELGDFWHGFMPYIYIMGAFCLCFILQDHLSGMILVVLTLIVLLLAGGAKIWHMGILGGMGALAATALAILEPYRLERLVAFSDPFADKLGGGWQIVQGLYAIGSGGIFGRGLGQSRQKFLYIPEAHNDYIYAIICEELGFIGAICITALFIAFVTRGIIIAVNSPDKFSSLSAFGIVTIIGLQYLINIAVVTSTIPNTGMQLPFFSSGGSSFVFIMAAMGVLLNISRYQKKSSKLLKENKK